MQQVDQIDPFMRLALKAQSQCRATLETLAAIKNPPVFARQANIANGPQQVNNGGRVEALAPALVRAAGAESIQTKLLEGEPAPTKRLDPRTSRRAGRRPHAVAAMGALDRPAPH